MFSDGGLLGFGLVQNPLVAYVLLAAAFLLIPISAEMWLFAGLFFAVAVLSSLGWLGVGTGMVFGGWGLLLQAIGAIFAIQIIFGLVSLALGILTFALPVIAVLLVMYLGAQFLQKGGFEVNPLHIVIFLLLLLLII